jgi:hypothetical protein
MDKNMDKKWQKNGQKNGKNQQLPVLAFGGVNFIIEGPSATPIKEPD